MAQLLMTPDGKKVQADITKDERLYDAPHNPPNTGTAYTSGTDLYVHKARSGKTYFYTHFWSMWQGTDSSYELLTEDEAKEFILDKAQGAGYVAGGVMDDACEKYFPGIFDEDA